jgi:hypothetical protein
VSVCLSGYHQTQAGREGGEVDGRRQTVKQWQRSNWKDSGWTEKTGKWKTQDVSYINKP